MATTKVSPRKAQVTKVKVAAAHPTTAVMVTDALRTLNERKGSSLQAIKKYVAANYMVDITKMAPFIRRFLVFAASAGDIIQTKGTGASGSFKLPKDAKKSTAAIKSKEVAKPQQPKVKVENMKKKVAPSKAKKSAKPPTQKPKSPKAKKVATKSVPAKKTAMKKK